MEKRLKVENISKKKKPVLTRKRFKNPDEVHQYFRLEKFTGKPACVMCKYQWCDNIFEKKRVGVYNRDIKRTIHGCAYCDVAICKNHFEIFTQLQKHVKGPEVFNTYGCL